MNSPRSTSSNDNRRKRIDEMLSRPPSPTSLNVPKYYTRNPNLKNRNTIRATIKASQQKIQPSFLNRFFGRKLPEGTFKKTTIGGKRRVKEYELRALSELSYRSPNVAKSNVKHLQNKQDKKMLAKLLNKSTRKIRRRN